MNIPAGSPARLSFFNNYDTESRYDGGVLEYSVNGGTDWYDILAGNSGSIVANPNRFIQGEYNTASVSAGPLSGRSAWTGDSSGYIETIVDLSDFTGENLLLRWRMGCDGSVSREGWWVDDIRVFYGSACVSDTCDLFQATASSTEDYFVCDGSTTQLSCSTVGASGSLTYSWSPADTLNAGNIINPIAAPSETTTYIVTVSDGNCQDTSSVTIYVYGVGPLHPYLEAWNTPNPTFDVDVSGVVNILDYLTVEGSCEP